MSRCARLVLVLLLVLVAGSGGLSLAAHAAERSRLVSELSSPQAFAELDGDAAAVPDGNDGRRVVRFDGPFSGRLDLKPLGINPREYDLLKIRVQADPRSTLQVSLENYPEPGQLSHWYLYTKTRGAFGWETACIDLHRPEEIKQAGTYKGLEAEDPSLRGLRISGFVADMKREAQPPGRRIWLGPVRFVKKTVAIDWDQKTFELTQSDGGDLVYTYPLTVANLTDEPVTATLRLVPQGAEHATAKLESERVELKAGEARTVTATVTLPAKIAAAKPPLYCERFLAFAEAEGVPASDVTILRSSDPVPLTVTVPIPEERLRFPLLPRRKDLPDEVLGFDRHREEAKELAAAVRPQDLIESLGDEVSPSREGRRGRGLFTWGQNEIGQQYVQGLTACAFLYDFTGDEQYLKKGVALLKAAAELFPELREEWSEQDVIQISHGLFAPNTLRLGWATGGMRPPYLYDKHGMFNDFDLLAADMSEADRRAIIDGFILPAAIHMRNHTFGLGNQQDVVNYAILYGGLASRNWPLVSFAYSSDYGLLNQIQWDFNDDGLAGEGHYHTPAVRPILYATELLYGVGIDLYDERLYQITHSQAAEAIGKPFRDPIRDYLDEHRFGPNGIEAVAKKTDGLHLAGGVTSLRWGPLEVAMNWGTQIHRGAPDRMSLSIDAKGERHPLWKVGGGNYSHSTLGQSLIIVDESQQEPAPAEVTGYDVEGEVQFVQATSDDHFPGATITRTFALVGECVLVLDRAESDEPRTYDWCLRYPGGNRTHETLAEGLSLDADFHRGSFTDKPGDSDKGVNFGANLRSDGYYAATTDEMWRQEWGALTMAEAPGTRVMAFAVPAAFSAARKERQTGVPLLMARRDGVKSTDFVAAFSPDVTAVVQLPVRTADGRRADAIGVQVTLKDGSTFRAIANFEPADTTVRLGELKTSARFATDWTGGE